MHKGKSHFTEHEHVQDVKEEAEDFAICEPPEGEAGGAGGGSPGVTEAGKRTSAEMGPDTNQSTSSKRARVSGEVSSGKFGFHIQYATTVRCVLMLFILSR